MANSTSKRQKLIDSIFARHEQTQKSRDRYTKTARDAKRKIAISKGMSIPKWETYWEEEVMWKKYAADRDLETELHPLDLAPPPVDLPPRPARPEDLEDVLLRPLFFKACLKNEGCEMALKCLWDSISAG